jgi:arsenate reductase
MAEGYLQSLDEMLDVYSAGTNPEPEINPYAVQVMKEIGIDISMNYPKSVDLFIEEEFDYVITVCDKARENCPMFYGYVENMLHYGFEDPAQARGTEEEILKKYRQIRDQITQQFDQFYDIELMSNQE